jgi:hypothetical protein
VGGSRLRGEGRRTLRGQLRCGVGPVPPAVSASPPFRAVHQPTSDRHLQRRGTRDQLAGGESVTAGCTSPRHARLYGGLTGGHATLYGAPTALPLMHPTAPVGEGHVLVHVALSAVLGRAEQLPGPGSGRRAVRGPEPTAPPHCAPLVVGPHGRPEPVSAPGRQGSFQPVTSTPPRQSRPSRFAGRYAAPGQPRRATGPQPRRPPDGGWSQAGQAVPASSCWPPAVCCLSHQRPALVR